jgi:hypothetical protein
MPSAAQQFSGSTAATLQVCTGKAVFDSPCPKIAHHETHDVPRVGLGSRPGGRRTSRSPRRRRSCPGRSIGARDIPGIASTGDHATNVQNRADRMTVLPAEAFRPWAELAVPPGLGNLPVHPGRFVGLARELARLDGGRSASTGRGFTVLAISACQPLHDLCSVV